MSDISVLKINNVEYSVKDTTAREAGGMTDDEKSTLTNLNNIIIQGSLPEMYRRNAWWTVSQTSITTPSYMVININDSGYVVTSPVTIDINTESNWDDSQYATAANRAGKDFYIYSVTPSSGITPNFILSASSTVPAGYSASNSRKIGGFHCLCLSIGTISGHTLSGYVTGDILPNSLWDLNFRAVSANEGMVFVDQINKWVDIYLPSLSNSLLASIYGGVIVDGASSTIYDGMDFFTGFGKVKKTLISYTEFVVASWGSNQKTNISGYSDPNTTGGHTDTAGRRMTSNFGLEDCCGALCQWGRDILEGGEYGMESGTNTYLSGYDWKSIPVGSDYGQCFGLLRLPHFGGGWDNSTGCGSRSIGCNCFPSYRSSYISSRGVSETLGKK